MTVDPLTEQFYGPSKDPFDANQAIPTLIFGSDAARAGFGKMFPDLEIRNVYCFSYFAYPLSGGFRPWSLLTGPMAALLLRLERALDPVLGRLMGFRLFVSLEKRP